MVPPRVSIRIFIYTAVYVIFCKKYPLHTVTTCTRAIYAVQYFCVHVYIYTYFYSFTESSDYTLNSNHTLFPGSANWYNDYYCRQVIHVCEDNIPENDENVTIIISTTAVRVSLTRNTFTLHIIDNDGEKEYIYIQKRLNRTSVHSFSA